jgi:hypothetical protein
MSDINTNTNTTINTIIDAAISLDLHHIYRDSNHHSIEVDGIEVCYASTESDIRYAYRKLKPLIPQEMDVKVFFLIPSETPSIYLHDKTQIEL